MKRNILKVCLIISLLFMIFGALTTTVNASDQEYEAKNAVSSFLTALKKGNSFALYYIDTNNTQLYSTAQNKLRSYDYLNYNIVDVEQKGDDIKLKVIISAITSEDVKVNGLETEFTVKLIGGSHKITNTNLFEKTSAENITGTILRIVIIAILVVGVLFGAFAVIIVVIINIRKNKKK